MNQEESTIGLDSVIAARYRLVRQLGQDAAVQTWEAFDDRLDRPVTLRVLTEQMRDDGAAQAQLRRVARGRHQAAGDVTSLRVLDGGEDPEYGPFVVTELPSSLEATQAISVISPPPPVVWPPAVPPPIQPGPPRSAPRTTVATRADGRRSGRFGILALIAVVLVGLAALVFLARLMAPAGLGVATSPVATATAVQATRPLSGAQPGEPAAAKSTAVPTLVAPAQPAAGTSVQAAAQPTPQSPEPTPQTAPAAVPPAAEPTRQATQGSAPAAARPTPQTAAPATAKPTPLTAQATAPPPASPVDTIRQHYTLINAKRYSDGYMLMDAHLRSLNSPADYAAWFANKVAVSPISVDVVSQTPTQAVVSSVVQSTDTVNGRDVTAQVSEQFVLVSENGAWRIDQVTRL